MLDFTFLLYLQYDLIIMCWVLTLATTLTVSPGLVDFAIGLVNSVLNLPDGQVMFFEEFKLKKNCEINSACQKAFGASWNDVWASKC